MSDETIKNIAAQDASKEGEVMPHPDRAASVSAHPEQPQVPSSAGNMATILNEIKLPERQSFRGGADKKVPPIVTVMPKKPEAPISEPLPRIAEVVNAGESHDTDSVVTPMRTFTHDMQDIVAQQKISLVHAVALEEEKRSGQEHLMVQSVARHQRTQRVMTILFGIVVLVGLGGAALFGVMTIANQQANHPSTIAQDTSLLFAEQTVIFPLHETSAADAKNAISKFRASSSGSLGSIVRIIPVVDTKNPDGTASQRPATTDEFLTAIGVHPPEDLMRVLGDQFFLGIHTVDKNAPVFIIPVTSYDHAFADMLAWEPAMNSDLQPLFTAVPVLTMGSDNIPAQRKFVDEVMRNYDTRALKDDAGHIELYYTFPNRNILIIAESPYSLTEVLSRLQAARRI